mmetsp:Transcript_8662/g.21338  ORF Transcript_8662/g.21338 Transcript_8662/m.21338 type:complete len:380 (+) Transcript_8662:572-1711(+)
MLRDANISTVKLDCQLLSVETERGGAASWARSVSVLCEREPVTASVFIDASYDGEVMAAAGDVEYTSGREARDVQREPRRRVRPELGRSPRPARGERAGRGREAAPHRLCVSGANDRVPWPRPEGYDRRDFTLMQRALEADNGSASFFTSMPPARLPGLPLNISKFCLCCGVTVGATDQPNLNRGWANASWDRKQEIIADHTLGSFYYFANDPDVPPAVRKTFNQYGLCADEFEEFGHIPPQLYVRISNRLVGDYVMTQNNITSPRNKEDSIAVGDWSFDEHMTGKYAVPTGDGGFEVMLEGNFWPPIEPDGSNWYDVPFNIMLPKRGTGANLLVPVALPASAVTYSYYDVDSCFEHMNFDIHCDDVTPLISNHFPLIK